MEIITIVLFIICILAAYMLGRFLRYKDIKNHRQDAIIRSRSVLSGQFSEQLAPFLPGFSYNPSECKFLGKPIDFVVFKGLDSKEIEEVVFLEVKSGKSQLNNSQKSLKKAIEKGAVRFEEYRAPEDVTSKKDN